MPLVEPLNPNLNSSYLDRSGSATPVFDIIAQVHRLAVLGSRPPPFGRLRVGYLQVVAEPPIVASQPKVADPAPQ